MRRRHHMNNIFDMFLSLVNGSKEELRNYLEQHGDVNLRGDNKCTLLIQTIMNDDIEKATLLIDSCCDVNLTDRDGITAIHLAVEKGDNSLLERLLRAHADVNLIYQHVTPLMLACRQKNYEAAEMLIKLGDGCCVNLENDCQETALSQAVICDANDICRLLLQNQASVQTCYNSNFKSKINRHLCNNYELMKIFLNYGENVDLHYHFQMSCILQKFDIAKLILAHFQDPFVLHGLGLIIGIRYYYENTWEELCKTVIKPYKLATKCSTDNKLLSMLLGMCKIQNATQKKIHKERACLLLRILAHHGLVLHPQTTLQSCPPDCECRKCIFTAMYTCPAVTSLKGQCCSLIRQHITSPGPMLDLNNVQSLPIPTILKQFICFDDW